MRQNRREFLKQAGVAGAAAVAGSGALVAPAAAQAAGAGKGASPSPVVMPKQMTFVTLSQGGAWSLGVKTARGILDVKKAAAAQKAAVPTTIDDLIQGGDRGLGEFVKKMVDKGDKALFLDEAAVTFGPSVTNPEKILCVGLNYARHAKETNNPIPKMPILFNKFNNALNSHKGVVRVSDVPATNFDYESELVIVMGKRAHKVSESEAPSYVFGYCNGNDFTARDLQQRSSQWMIGKTFDGSGLLGPYLVTADQVDQNNLKVEGTVNGEVRQSSNTSDMVFNCAQIIAYASNLMTLEAGDIIYTGTPEGVITGYPKEKQVWLKPGDKLTTTIGNLGTLSFSLV
jgi:2-keto-4-pentenoate hydratase/2-oxohepta-3-ene-1,7-dioic acid hydratase in catechol pathway